MATNRLTLINEKGGVRSVTPESWKKLPKDKQGTYNGWRLQEGSYVATAKRQATVSSGKTQSEAQPPFIPQEVRAMRDAEMKAKDEEIEKLRAMLNGTIEVKKETSDISGVGQDGTIEVKKDVSEANIPAMSLTDLGKESKPETKPNETVKSLNPDGTAKTSNKK